MENQLQLVSFEQAMKLKEFRFEWETAHYYSRNFSLLKSISNTNRTFDFNCEFSDDLDFFVAFFLTSKSAHEYLKYQKHNLSKEAYVYVFYSGYRNFEIYNF